MGGEPGDKALKVRMLVWKEKKDWIKRFEMAVCSIESNSPIHRYFDLGSRGRYER